MISWLPSVVLFVATAASIATAIAAATTPTTSTTTTTATTTTTSTATTTTTATTTPATREAAASLQLSSAAGGASSLAGARANNSHRPSSTQQALSGAEEAANTKQQHSQLVEGALTIEQQVEEPQAAKQHTQQAPTQSTSTSSSSQASLSSMQTSVKRQQQPIYTNQFVIQVKGGELEARKLAQKHGFIYLNHILGDYYHLEHKRLSKRSISPTQDALNISIQDEPQVLLLERQVLKRRVKRDFLELSPLPPTANINNNNNYNNQHFQQLAMRAHDAHSSGAFVRAPNQQRAPPNQQQHLQHQQQQQMLRPNSSLRPAHHHYTRPANQPPAVEARVGVLALQRSHQQHGGSSGAGHRFHTPASQYEAGAGRTQEMLETAATSGSLLFQQASIAAAAAAAAQQQPPTTTTTAQTTTSGASSQHKQRPQVNPLMMEQFNLSQSQSYSSASPALLGSLLPAPLGSNGTMHLASNKQQQPAPFNDPSWPLMWYLDGGAKNGFDLNVMAAWKMGYTGKGIVITILDDGLEKDHPDLQANYDPLASFDINGDDADPMPRYDAGDSNRHGTRCAGEVAAVPDNNICSIGIAYNSKVGGVRMLDGDVTDAVEARSLGLNNQHIHIYSASWGPDDNGKTVDGPGEMATRAFIEGVTKGRQGLGSIFVFASGNGGREHDNCNCDGYTNSIWTLSISSATENGNVPWYIEACSSTLATTYSSGDHKERQITTTDLHHSCTPNHTGTSASAPLAAGICALVLESNPRLTWRDMQHIVVRTAKPANLVAKDWRTNALGRNVSHAFGYGLMDAAAMITMAKRWTTVPIQYTCEVRSPTMEKFIPAKGYIELKLKAECSNVRYLEHVQSKVTLTSSRRGDLHIYLVSPHGTRSTLLAQRPNDQAEQGFRNWPFMTVHNWGESPNGIWTLEVHNDGKPQSRAYLKEWTLILYGTYDDPNKHLDSLATAHQQQQQQQPPTPLDHHQNNHQQTNVNLNHHQQQHVHHHQANNNNNINHPVVLDKKPPGPLQTTVVLTHSNGEVNSAPVTPTLKQPVSSPPPPLPALNNHHPMAGNEQQHVDSQLHAPVNPHQMTPNRPASGSSSLSSGGGSQWASSPLPPPPVSSGSSSSSKSQQLAASTPPTPATSTSTYLTTFKTIVSTSSSSSSSSSSSATQPPPPPPGPVQQDDQHHHTHQHQQQQQQQHTFQSAPNAGGSRIHVSQHPPKADFEVVSPPPSNFKSSISSTSSLPATDSTTDQRIPLRPPVQSHHHNQLEIVQPSNHLAANGYSNHSQQQHHHHLLAPADHNNHNYAPKTPNNQMTDGGDRAEANMPMKPSVSQQDTLLTVANNNSYNNSNNNNNNNNNTNNQEIDANQIDSKLLTKDYRSSGDQSIYSAKAGSVNDINKQASDASGSNTLAKQQNSSTTVSASININCWPYIFVTMLILFHLTKPLVRPIKVY